MVTDGHAATPSLLSLLLAQYTPVPRSAVAPLFLHWCRRPQHSDVGASRLFLIPQHPLEPPGIVEDDLDLWWEVATGDRVSEVVFPSRYTVVSNRHTAVSNLPMLTVHPIGVDRCLVPEFEIALEGTHHGPVTNTLALFVEIEITVLYLHLDHKMSESEEHLAKIRKKEDTTTCWGQWWRIKRH